MFRGRGKKVAAAAGASVVMAMTSLAVVPLVASASGTGTATALTATPTHTATGNPITISAQVSVPVTQNADIPTGTVLFTITGHNHSTVSCSKGNSKAISGSGLAQCKVAAGLLQGAASPYTIEGAYSGDSNFASSSGTTTETVTAAKTKMKLTVKPAVKNDSANTFTATLTAKKATKLLAGQQVVFSVSDVPPTKNAKRICAGGDSVTVIVKKKVATAKCLLAAGWFTLPKHTPEATWDVTASLGTSANFVGKTETLNGMLN
ncbi:MAG TPA: hypothetical protein VN816_01405 [Acidimicrobiales bacterium]|nr:hypothetical protein [Acidimicrobiales bacterium]